MELLELSGTDFGPYAEFKLPLNKQGLVWLGGVNNDTSAANSNGSGKTTIFKAVSWALFGETVDGEKGDKVIRNGATKAVVNIKFNDSNGKVWTITRQRTKGTPRCTLYRPNGDIFDGGKQEIQERINSMIGLDFKAFKNTVLYGQNDSSRFANPATKDADRKVMLHKILNTELLSLCHDKVIEISRKLKAEIKDAELVVANNRMAMNEHDLESLKRKCEDWEEDRESNIEQLKNDAKKCRDHAKQLLLSIDSNSEQDETCDIGAVENSILLHEELLKRLEVRQEEAKEIREDVNGLEVKYSTATIDVQSCKKDLEVLLDKMKSLDGNECPICTTSLLDGVAHQHVNKLKNEIGVARNRLQLAKSKMSDSKIDLDALRARYLELENSIKKIPKILREISEMHMELSEARLKIEKNKHKVEEIKSRAKSKIEEAKRYVAEIDIEKKKVNPHTEQFSTATERVIACGKAIDGAIEKMEEKNFELAHYDFWKNGFSNQGLPSYILDKIMPSITERSNHYLEILSDGDITMEFTTQRELKSAKGEMRDEIEIRWFIEGIEMYPPSGGQLKKMEIATDLALMDLVSANEGGSIDLLMLDEVFDGLDSEGVSRVFTLLQKLRSKRGSIFVVSHDSKMGEGFEKGICAVKKDGVATLETI